MSDAPEGFDFGALLEQAQEMQAQLMAAQAAAAEQVHDGVAGGGAVTISVTGGIEFLSVDIRPDAVDPNDVEMLEDLVLAALHDAMRKIAEAQQSSLGGLVPPGMDGVLGLGPPA
ncbi:MAG: nucleoid-associated protein EbfC [Actinomycetota bacterium]|jgi:DNA-binding YbaB/EbfC family protein|nr:nucleoid-associated protein EbfC [Actinomycetota bacterium]